jgi:PAS domain S-box-containing protein
MPTTDPTTGRQAVRLSKYEFFALFLPIAVLVLVLGISFASMRTKARIEEIVDHDAARLHLISGFLGAEVLGSLKHLRSLPGEAITMQALDSPDPGHRRALESSFLTLARRNPQYQQIRWIDESGIEKVRIMRDQGEPYVVDPGDLQDKSNRYYFEAVNELMPGELYISHIDLNVEQGQIEMPPRPMLRIATPVEDSGRKRHGIIIINIAMKNLFDLARHPGPADREAEYLLINQQGVLLNADLENQDTADAQAQDMDFTLTSPDIWAAVARNESGSLESNDGLWTWKTLAPLNAFKKLTRAFPQRTSAFDELISDDFSLTLIAHRPPSALEDLRREIRMLTSLGIIFSLAIYAFSLFLYLGSNVRARRAEVDAAYATARAASLEHMKELEERFHRLVEASSIGQLVVDGDGRIEISNPAADRMLGYENGELAGVSVDSLLPDRLREKHASYREKFMQAPETRTMGAGRKLVAVRKDGTTLPVEVGLSPYSDHGRQLVLASIIDLSDQNSAET